ncbi:hypothetical protein [Streptomyces chartreusis]|uniref:hypothetical protein n=1 Tax=Streptomyces chartreusis TaxID=1969 RepID=UPI00362734F2
MLRRLSADDERFKEVSFVEGLNLIVASTTASSADTDSRNSAGKSSLIELIHFLLGARATNTTLAMNKALRHITFTLELDWPGLSGPPQRSACRLRDARRGRDRDGRWCHVSPHWRRRAARGAVDTADRAGPLRSAR